MEIEIFETIWFNLNLFTIKKTCLVILHNKKINYSVFTFCTHVKQGKFDFQLFILSMQLRIVDLQKIVNCRLNIVLFCLSAWVDITVKKCAQIRPEGCSDGIKYPGKALFSFDANFSTKLILHSTRVCEQKAKVSTRRDCELK
ncbi:hypothetical protein BpHYR1_050801 [Brachionus plicatilis]|uniref:Uncharacterized protein n=1 Tax=Brachionus plicatilis TaxID=10195 RepID=A0A3M7T7G6_BRAPC|nr:hypothetical protein BpHYR1_050801 [Brachionus plicatilis]